MATVITTMTAPAKVWTAPYGDDDSDDDGGEDEMAVMMMMMMVTMASVTMTMG